jgi:hypothetical protein
VIGRLTNIFGRSYGYPDVGRAGLGNMLFPWARCFLWCRDNQAQMIAPRWRRLRLGPYLRRELDKRQYHRFFHHRGYVAGPERVQALLALRRMNEATAPLDREGARGTVVVFSGMTDYFQGLLGRDVEVFAELVRITRPEFQPAAIVDRPFIGIHVRCGDFAIPENSDALRRGGFNYRVSIDWYVQALRALRTVIGGLASALVFSDGRPEDLRGLLSEPNVTLSRNGAAISDLLALGRSRALIASGSSFSMWASYLGQVPTLWYPGQRRQCVVGVVPPASLEPEWEPRVPLNASFGDAVVRRWSAGVQG